MRAAHANPSLGAIVCCIVSLLGAMPAVGDIIVDNSDAGFSVLAGTWMTGSMGTPWGADYRWRSATSGTPVGEVEWRPVLPSGGPYEVSVWYVAGANRTPCASFVVTHSGGSATVCVNEQIAGGQWVALGRYRFDAGASGCVRLNDSAPPDVVVADAVRFRRLTASIDADFNDDGDVDEVDFLHLRTCLTGARASPAETGCENADFDGDEDIDLEDFGVFQRCFSGPNVDADPDCLRRPDPIPPRPADAITGSAFIAEVMNVSLDQREQRILEEVLKGNIPEYLRGFVLITVTSADGAHTCRYEVMPDYLCIGSDADFVRMPMTPLVAQPIADAFECILPTRKMVNSIHASAAVKLQPSPISPSSTDITAVSTFYQHHLTIETQRAGHALGLLVGGHKKDVVITPLLATHPGRVAIYGWHYPDGTPIQPLYLGHTVTYVDYSHGIRLVKQRVIVDGAEASIIDVLNDAALAPMLSDEGLVPDSSY